MSREASPKTAPAAGSALDAFQRDFTAALLGDAAAPGSTSALLAAQPGFAVYRNTVAAGCIAALGANYPTVARLVGEAWFGDAAAIFARAHPPSDGSLVAYGEGFPAFLAGFAPAGELPYLAAVARLDRFWSEAHVAADRPVLEASALAALAPEELAMSTLVPHPAARWAWFADAPAFTIWRRHREGADLAADLDWHGEGALVVRPNAAVAWHALDAAGIAFLDACARGLSFAEAAEAAAAQGDAIAVLLARLVGAGAFESLAR